VGWRGFGKDNSQSSKNVGKGNTHDWRDRLFQLKKEKENRAQGWNMQRYIEEGTNFTL